MLSKKARLKVIASLIPKGVSVCDVGTDHGFLPAYLYLSGEYKSVCATDINKKPLKNAEQNLKRLGAFGVKLILCDGLSGVNRSEADAVVIAGMGGEVIAKIIHYCPFLRDSSVTLILQPMTGAEHLRLYLAENGFSVNKETAVAENNKIYSVMVCAFCGKPYKIGKARQKIGILKKTNEENQKYIDKQIKILEKCAAELQKSDKARAEHFLETAKEIGILSEDKNGV